MKLILLTFCVLFVAVQNSEGDDKSMKSLKECLDERDIKESDYTKLEEDDDPKVRCIMACVMEKEGVMKNGELIMDKLKKDLLEDAEELGEKKVSEIANYCGNLAKDLTDICDKSSLIELCLEEEFDKYNIKFEN